MRIDKMKKLRNGICEKSDTKSLMRIDCDSRSSNGSTS